jgi:hypothetical protein
VSNDSVVPAGIYDVAVTLAGTEETVLKAPAWS